MSRNRKQPIEHPQFGGPDEPPEKLLTEVHRYVLENALREKDWYAASVGSKRRWSMALRGGSLILVALSGLLPLINTLGTEAHWPTTAFFPAPMTLITLFIAMASGFIAIDKFWGFSSGWLRYLRTRQMLENRIEVFHLEWAAAWPPKGSPIGTAEMTMLVKIARKLLDDVNMYVGEETNAWIQEFNTNLQSLDSQVEKKKAEREAVEASTGNLDLKVLTSDVESWTARVDDRSQTFTSRTGTLGRVPAGLQVIVVTGLRKGKEVRFETSISVVAGQATAIEVSFD